jgi:hypothetical protein
MNIMIYMSLWWILWYIWYSCDFWVFLNVKNKKMQWPLCRAFSGRCTTKWPKPTACLCCAFIGAHGKGAIYCRAFCASAHGKELSLPCVFLPAHGKGRHTLSHPVAVSCFFCRAPWKTHGKDYLPCVVRRGVRQRGFTVQNATVCPLPCAPDKKRMAKSLPCVLGFCRAPVRCFP